MYIQPPVYTKDGLVAPWHLKIEARIPAHLVAAAPSSARVDLVVAGEVVATLQAGVETGNGAYVVSAETVYTSIEWPQRKYIPVKDEAMENVTSAVVDAGAGYAAVYAGGAGRICVGPVCEDTDIDGDGIVEVVYLARPGERVTVTCEERCTVRTWRAPTLNQLDATVRVTLLDANGNAITTYDFPAVTYEAPIFVPEGFTIRIDPKYGVQWPWCGAELPGYKPGTAPPPLERMETSTGVLGAAALYDIDASTVENDASVPFGAGYVYAGFDDYWALYGNLQGFYYNAQTGWPAPREFPSRFYGRDDPCTIASIPSSILVLDVTYERALSLGIVIAGTDEKSVIVTRPWGSVSYVSGYPVWNPPRYNGYTLRSTYAFCPKSNTSYTVQLSTWYVATFWLPGCKVLADGRIVYDENTRPLIGDRGAAGTTTGIVVTTDRYAFILEFGPAHVVNNRWSILYGAKVVESTSVTIDCSASYSVPRVTRIALRCYA